MNSAARPRVSVGLPVRDGERFLVETLDSLLAQTFTEFELIISDNGSTDATRGICEARAAADRRVRYYRNDRNLGARWNFNRVFELSTGEYFKWAAYDDLLAPSYLERCVEVLDRDPSIVVCFSRAAVIDEEGRPGGDRPYWANTSSPRPHERFDDIIHLRHLDQPIFGLIRASVLRRTPLLRPVAMLDRLLLAELALHGPFHELPETLFFHREHAARPEFALPGYYRQTVWVDPAMEGRLVFPRWRLLAEYCGAIGRAPLTPVERIHCIRAVAHRGVTRWRNVAQDLVVAGRQLVSRRRMALPPVSCRAAGPAESPRLPPAPGE